MAAPATPGHRLLRQLEPPPIRPARWIHWAARLDPLGRLTLPSAARMVVGDDSTVRASSRGDALVLRRHGLGRPTHVDTRGRLYVPAWLRRLVDDAGSVLVSAQRPDVDTVAVAAGDVLDALADGAVEEVR